MITDKHTLNRMLEKLPSWLGVVAIGIAAILAIGIAAILIAAFIIFFEF